MALKNSHKRRNKRQKSLRVPRTRENLAPRKQAPEETDSRTGTEWEPFDLSPEQIARLAMQGPPKKDWRYLQKE